MDAFDTTQLHEISPAIKSLVCTLAYLLVGVLMMLILQLNTIKIVRFLTLHITFTNASHKIHTHSSVCESYLHLVALSEICKM